MKEYTGYKILNLTEQEFANLYEKNQYISETYNFKENEYLIAKHNDTTDIFCYRKGKFERINYPYIKLKFNNTVKPLDDYQYCAIDLLQQSSVPVKLIEGCAGSGKDYLMFNQALSLIEKDKFEKIVFIRPNVTLANVPSIGYLPNGIEEKLAWTLGPLYDKAGGEDGLKHLEMEGKFEMVPLLFIRGRSFENSIVYVTEAQNIDTSIAKVLLSRIGNGSELWMNGDIQDQTDNRIFDKDNGFKKMIERLSGHPLFGNMYLPNVHRSEIAKLSNLLD